jgi:L,D-peptidoglycan transpeptidase YkuD (ErfK/YbiS/YcfS/YnhG family)
VPARFAALIACALLAACTSTSPSPSTTHSTAPAPSVPATTSTVTQPVTQPTTKAPSPSRHTTQRPTPTPRTSTVAPRPRASQLPLGYSTASARQVITVLAGAESDTQGVVQAWRRVPGGWHRVGPAVPAYLGYDGMTPYPSESRSAVPMGSYTLTQAFGRDEDPGTALPYRQTTPADWWISESGSLYNTEQHCDSGCGFTQGSPNEHLYYEVPYYDYAVVIDYNTRNSPSGVRQGAGSAFFLHVSAGRPTQGCVAIDRTQLVRIMQWLRPDAQPRILIGTG